MQEEHLKRGEEIEARIVEKVIKSHRVFIGQHQSETVGSCSVFHDS